MKKTKGHTRILWKNRMWPLLWELISDHKDSLLVMNWLTGEFRVVDK